MTEFRTDPITGRRVIIVPGRAARPNDHAIAPPAVPSDAGCPFCAGNETKTPGELAAFGPPGREPNGPGWYVRTIPNKFPTVGEELPKGMPGPSGGPALDRRPAFGHHEVVIASPTHSPLLPYLPEEQVARVVRMCRDRVRHLSTLPNVGSVTLFENAGPESGGSLWHPHAQLVTLPELSPSLTEELAGVERWRRRSRAACAFEETANVETADGSRLVLGSDEYRAYAPFASSVPYEVRILPRRHTPWFGDLSDSEADRLAGQLSAVLRAILSVLPGASYNFVVRSPAGPKESFDGYHWHLDILPRLVRPDGFDLGSGFSVNTVPPEVAAETLRAELGAKR